MYQNDVRTLMPELFIVNTDNPDNVLSPMQISSREGNISSGFTCLKIAMYFLKDMTDNLDLDKREVYIQSRGDNSAHVFIIDFPVSILIKDVTLEFNLMGPLDLENPNLETISIWKDIDIPEA